MGRGVGSGVALDGPSTNLAWVLSSQGLKTFPGLHLVCASSCLWLSHELVGW